MHVGDSGQRFERSAAVERLERLEQMLLEVGLLPGLDNSSNLKQQNPTLTLTAMRAIKILHAEDR